MKTWFGLSTRGHDDKSPDRLVRFNQPKGPIYGMIRGKRVFELKRGPFENPDEARDLEVGVFSHLLERLDIVEPVVPRKVIGIGYNYKERFKSKKDWPKQPQPFFKLPTSVNKHLGKIVFPPIMKTALFECELAVIIGKRAKNVKAADAKDYLLGYTCCNDVSGREIDHGGESNVALVKGPDTFCCLGPYIVLEGKFDASDLLIQCLVNGEVRQQSRTSNLVFGVPEIIEFLSQSFTLEPGDVITTGTPPGCEPLKSGDAVDVVIENIGTLRNYVA